MMKDLFLKTTLEVADELPESATIADIIDAILVRLSIKRGLKDIENGNIITQENLLKEIDTW